MTRAEMIATVEAVGTCMFRMFPLYEREALIAATAELRKMDWQPISTAPKDGMTPVLGWDPCGFARTAYWHGEWRTPIGTSGYMSIGAPLFWMPLPVPPPNTEGGE